jgi:hypothetical protein
MFDPSVRATIGHRSNCALHLTAGRPGRGWPRALDAYVDQLTRRESLESLEESRYQRAERFDPVHRGDKNDHRNRKSIEVLLVLQILISRQHRVEGRVSLSVRRR